MGWRAGDWSPPTEPTKEALDRVTGDTPAALMARDYHSLWLNSAALAHANGDLEVAGGVVERDERGEPTGVLREECAWHFRDTLRAPDRRRDGRSVARGGSHRDRARRHRPSTTRTAGSARSASGSAFATRARCTSASGSRSPPNRSSDLAAAAPLERLRRRPRPHRLPEGVHGRDARLADSAHARRHAACRSRAGTAGGDHPPRRRSGPARSPSTRSATSRTARRSTPSRRRARAWQPLGLRHRIEHAQLLAPEDLPRFAELGVAASVQFSHAPSDRDLADRFWAGKTDGAYAYRSLWDSGALLANGSDAPIEELDPWAGVCAGVLRTIDGRDPGIPSSDSRSTRRSQATTVNPAWLARDEHRRGKLLPGYLADLVVLDRDPYELEPEQLAGGQRRRDDARRALDTQSRRPGRIARGKFKRRRASSHGSWLGFRILRSFAGALDWPAASALPVDHAHGACRRRCVLDLHLGAVLTGRRWFSPSCSP